MRKINSEFKEILDLTNTTFEEVGKMLGCTKQYAYLLSINTSLSFQLARKNIQDILINNKINELQNEIEMLRKKMSIHENRDTNEVSKF